MTTEYNPEAIKAAANDLGHVMDDTSAFTGLQAPMPNFGNFDLAQWLEQVVDNSAAGIVADTENLRSTLTGMDTSLTDIVNTLESVDKDNADRIASSVSRVSDDLPRTPQEQLRSR